MKRLIIGVSVVAVLTMAGLASAQADMRRHHGWRHHASWHWYGPYAWQSRHIPSDFVAQRLNRQVYGQIGLRGSLGLDQVALNPQPLPPR